MVPTLLWIIFMTFVNGLVAFAGAVTLLISRKSLDKILFFLVSFSIGALLGGAFFHMIPEAIEGLDLFSVLVIGFFGVFLFYVVEKFLHWHHCHKGECHVHPYTHLILYGDGLHNFIDGLIIASAFIVNVPFGILTSFLIILHELPQEIGDFGVLVYGGLSRSRALVYNFLSQITAIVGGVLGYFFLGAQDLAVYVLPFAAGGFLYIAIKDLIPEVFGGRGGWVQKLINMGAIVLGILVLVSAKVFVE